MLICTKIKCPWFCEKTNGYGCRRYALSNACHLRKADSRLVPNQYGLYMDEPSGETLKLYQQENNRFCLEDSKYSEERKFFAENPDWVTENTFIPKEIVEV